MAYVVRLVCAICGRTYKVRSDEPRECPLCKK